VGDFFTVGPEFVRAPSREDYETGRFPASHIVQRASRYFPSLSVEDVTLDYTGIMVHLAGHSDWMIRADDRYPNCIQLLGIESPGLTCSLEIGKMVRALITGGKGRG
jgi:glycerol-3-phosphate dehydrogenase